MLRVLFVDDDAHFLQTLKGALERRAGQWFCDYVTSGEAALQILGNTTYDVVVTDWRMPGMSGTELLHHISLRSSAVIRIILSAEKETMLSQKALGIAHQILSKPCETDVLVQIIEKAVTLRKMLHAPHVIAAVHRLKGLPTIPRCFHAISQVLRREDYRLGELLRLMKEDPAISATILRVANSGFYGGREKISNLEIALTLLGANTITGIVIFSELFTGRFKCPGFDLDKLWRHSVNVANIALRLAKYFSADQNVRDDAFAAGLLHDMGKLIFLKKLPLQFRKAMTRIAKEGFPVHQTEVEIFGAGHEELGGYLFQLWGLPNPLVQAVAYHHQSLEVSCREISPLSLVSVANFIDHQQDAFAHEEKGLVKIENQLLTMIGEKAGMQWQGFHRAFLS